MMRSRSSAGLRLAPVLSLVLALVSGCGGPGPAGPAAAVKPAPTATAAGGSPVRTARAALTGAAPCNGTDVHSLHLSQFDCSVCHPLGARYGFTSPYVFPRGTTTASGTIVLATGTTPTTCTVACHYPMGGTAKSITWTTPGPLGCTDCHDVTNLPSTHPAIPPTDTTPDCLGCHQTTTHLSGTVTLVSHPTAWSDPTSPGFHAFSAVQGLADCQQCHAKDLGGGVTGVSCGSCHDKNLPAGVASWKTNCTMCHGGADNQSGAPPVATWGHAGVPNRGGGTLDPVRVGAHTTHVTGGSLGPALDCSVCHVVPSDALTVGHITGQPATVTFGGLASVHVNGTPTWDRASATCSATYCHGATLAGGTITAPTWTTVDGSQDACGTCHGLPPPSPHPTVTGGGNAACNLCHPATVDANGNVIPPAAGGKHLDGIIENTGGHPPSWMDTTSAGFHAFSADLKIAACESCHGAKLDGGTAGLACASCHVAGGTARDLGSCTACHGGVDNQTGAPPAATWGNAGDPNRGGGTLDPIRVGAHTAHLTGGGIAQPIPCQTCHVVPTDIFSAGHVDGPKATLTFSGTAVTGGAAPQWDRTNATCSSTYCHGNYAGAYTFEVYNFGSDTYDTYSVNYTGAMASPTWTGGPMTCGSCHGNPPQGTGTWHSATHDYGRGTACDLCHPDALTTASGNVITDVTLHMNGTVEVTPKWQAACFYCH